MFYIGEKIVYPLHGAGVIETIEEHEVLGEKQNYYVIRLIGTEMKVLVPANERTNLREIIKDKDVEKVISILENDIFENTCPDWKVRNANNLEKLRSGCIFKTAEVIKSLSTRHKKKGLSASEKRLFDNAFNMISGEIAFARNIGLDQASLMVNKVLQ